MTVPWDKSGDVTVTAKGTTSNATATATFDITSSGAGGGNHGVLSVTPTDGAPGTSVTVSGSAFDSGASVKVSFGGVVAGTATANSQGGFNAAMRVPNLPEGLVSVTGTGADETNPPKFYVDAGGTGGAPSLSVNPATVTMGDQVSVSGAGFGADEKVTIDFGSNSSSAESDDSGSFSATLTAPSVSNSQSVTITATGKSSGLTATASVEVQTSTTVGGNPDISLDPTSGAPGDSVKVTGSGYGANENVTVSFGSSSVTVNTGNKGNFTTAFIAPSVAATEELKVTAVGQTTEESASADFDDVVTASTQANITLSPASGAPGDSVTVSGTGFGDNENVLVSFGSATTVVNSTGAGNFSTSFTVPSETSAVTIHVTAIGKRTGDSAIASFDEDPGQGSGAPTRAQLEAQIVVLQQQVALLTSEIEDLLSGWSH
jgi:hypothetical protein